MFERVDAFVRDARQATMADELGQLLGEVAGELGFSYFALTHHVAFDGGVRDGVRLHNYPCGWQEYFDARKLGPSDPVHRASHGTSVGFAWSELPRMIRLTEADQQVLDDAGRFGIGNGFTVPAHVPGESNGSCSFAAAQGAALPEEQLATVQLIGAFAFEAARRIWRMRQPPVEQPALTGRQVECLLWVARGKSDWEVSKILGISHETAKRHIKQARERYGSSNRSLLAVNALFDGAITFREVLRR